MGKGKLNMVIILEHSRPAARIGIGGMVMKGLV